MPLHLRSTALSEIRIGIESAARCLLVVAPLQCESCRSSEDSAGGGAMRLFGRAEKETWAEKTRVTYFLQTDRELRDLTVIRC